jgi:hypothetical protein
MRRWEGEVVLSVADRLEVKYLHIYIYSSDTDKNK